MNFRFRSAQSRCPSRSRSRSGLGSRALWLIAALVLITSHAAADTVHLTSGGKLVGTITEETKTHVTVETKFGPQKIERSRVASIDRGLTPKEKIEAAVEALEPSDADGRFALAMDAKEAGLRQLHESLVADVLRLDKNHKDANEFLGNVLYRGDYVSVAKRERLEKEARAAKMMESGLVEHDGRFVTPEEKAKLEQGLQLRDGEWVSETEARARDGFVLHGDAWIRQEDAHVEEVKAEISKLLKHPFFVHTTNHVAVYSDIATVPKDLAELLERGWKVFTDEFELGPGLEWFGGKRIDIFVVKSRFDYQTFVDWLGTERGMGADWAARARDVISIFRYQTWGMAATYVANRGELDAAHHMANQLGHVLLNRYRCEGRRLPPFFDDAYAALMEFTLLDRNLVFTVGTGRYERSIVKDEMAFFEDGNWLEPLKNAMRSRSDTGLENVVRRDYGDMTQMDVGKGMALYMRWRSQDGGKVKKFHDALRDFWPGGNPAPGHVDVLRAIERAFRVVENKDIPPVDQELRRYVMALKKSDMKLKSEEGTGGE